MHADFAGRGLIKDNLEWRFCYDPWNLVCYPSGPQRVLGPSVWQWIASFVTVPLKRTLDRPLGHLIVQYGATGNEEAFVDPDPRNVDMQNENGSRLRPTVTGQLFVY